MEGTGTHHHHNRSALPHLLGAWAVGFLCCLVPALLVYSVWGSGRTASTPRVLNHSDHGQSHPLSTSETKETPSLHQPRVAPNHVLSGSTRHLVDADGVDFGEIVSLSAPFQSEESPRDRRDLVYNVYLNTAQCFTFYHPEQISASVPQGRQRSGRLRMQKFPALGRRANVGRGWRPLKGYKLQFRDAHCASVPMMDLSLKAARWYQARGGNVPVFLPLDVCMELGSRVFKLLPHSPQEKDGVMPFEPQSYCYVTYPDRLSIEDRSASQGDRFPFANGLCDKCHQTQTLYTDSKWVEWREVTKLLPNGKGPKNPVHVSLH